MGRDPLTYIFSWKRVLRVLPGIASATRLEFGIGQRDEVRVKVSSKREGR